MADQLDGEAPYFTSIFSNAVIDPSTPAHEMLLKKNDYCFLMATFSLEERAINNAKVQIIRFYRNGILVRILSNNKQIIVTRKSYSIDVQSKRRNVISFTLLRRQFPLRLCYAMTFNKCQGQTPHRISIDLRFPVFTHGQLYVAFGRATRRENVLSLITEENISSSEPDTYLTINVVHRILLAGIK